MIKKELCAKAIALDACKSELQALRAAKTLDELFSVYWDNIHFCTRNDFPPVGFFKQTMKHEARKRNIYVNETNTLEAAGGFRAIFLGDCRSVIRTSNSHFTRLYARHTSQITVHASTGNIVVIDLYDNARAIIKGVAGAKVAVFKMGGGHVEGKEVMVFEKPLNP